MFRLCLKDGKEGGFIDDVGDVGAYGAIGVIWLKKTFLRSDITIWPLLALLDTAIHVCTFFFT